MQKRNLTAVVVVLIAVAATIVHIRSLDGLQGYLLAPIRKPDTEYAPGYTEKGFREVRLGQTRDDVIALLGQPLHKRSVRKGAAEGWLYSQSPGSRDYRYREIQFADGLVTHRIHYYYVD